MAARHEDPAEVAAALASGAKVRVTSAGRSMWPTVARGASVLVRRGRPAVGDVVLLRGDGTLILHRLVARVALLGYGRWVHAGDHPEAAPGLCRPGEVLGIADLPRRHTSPPGTARLVAQAFARAGLARLRALLNRR